MNMEKLVTFQDRGNILGVLHLPDHYQHESTPIVIYCPGMNGERYEVHRLAVKFARYLCDRGIGFFRFDYYGIGVSDGLYHEMTNTTKVSNVQHALKFLQEENVVQAENVILLGFSDGARIALKTANHSAVNKVMMWSPIIWDIVDDEKQISAENKFIFHPQYKTIMKPWIGLWLGMNYFQDYQNFQLEKEVDHFSGKLLQIYSDDDPIAGYTWSKLQNYKPFIEKSDIHFVNKAGHLFTSVPLENILMEKTYHWILKQFNEEVSEDDHNSEEVWDR
ncbi:alpha/beta hydrolase [Chengkuizengella sp. YPA3-1-1]|uniref:Alpha/beta hydrolase n=2 Tax=Chengkuizengella marina TaxID=2507566 RepID=A0A6N9Q4P4_9BACL|nr:alpha/beta hydrolase [Chengkuizengella marina]